MTRKLTLHLTVFAAFILLISTNLCAITITVSPDGSQDVQTIQEALDAIDASDADGADTVLIFPGTYKERASIWNQSGSLADPIVIKSTQSLGAIIDGSVDYIDPNDGSTFQEALLMIRGCQHIHIEGLQIINSDWMGILAWDTDNIRVTNCYSHNTVSSGIGIWFGNDVIVESNEIELACTEEGIVAPDPNNIYNVAKRSQECLTVANCERFTISNNHVHSNKSATGLWGGEGIDAKQSAVGNINNNHVHDIIRTGIYIDAYDQHGHTIRVFSNDIHDNDSWGLALANEHSGFLEDVHVYNNLSYRNKFWGFGIQTWSDFEGLTHEMNNLHIYNNVAYDNGTGGWGGGLDINCDECDSVFVTNNIFSGNSSNQFEIRDGNSPDYTYLSNNIFQGTYSNNHTIRPGTTVDEQSTFAVDPLLSNPANGDFNLTAPSPAIDAGINYYQLSTDYDLNARNSSAIDIGAFEFHTIEDKDNDGVFSDQDCDDNDSTVTGLRTWYFDLDNDGEGDPSSTLLSCSQPQGYVLSATDKCPGDASKTTPGSCGCGIVEGTCDDCAGVPNGTAYTDECDECVGGSTGESPCDPVCENAITNDEFDQGLTGWTNWNNTTTTATTSVLADGSMSGQNSVMIDITNGGSSDWEVDLKHTFPITTNRTYHLTFDAQANAPRNITVALKRSSAPWTTYWSTQVALSENIQSYSYQFTTNSIDPSSQLNFLFGGNDESVQLDNVWIASCEEMVASIHGTNVTKAFIYPNPTSGTLHFSSPTKWEILTLEGKTVMTGAANETNVSSLSLGVYVVRQGKQTYRLVVQ